jgi:hypothetical protein
MAPAIPPATPPRCRVPAPVAGNARPVGCGGDVREDGCSGGTRPRTLLVSVGVVPGVVKASGVSVAAGV